MSTVTRRWLLYLIVAVGSMASAMPLDAAPLHIVVSRDNLDTTLRFDAATGNQMSGVTDPPYVSAAVPDAWGIAVDNEAHKIYVSSFDVAGDPATRIYRLNTDGSLDTTFNGTGSMSLTDGVTNGDQSWSLRMGPDGNLYAASLTANRIWQINTNTATASVFASTNLFAPLDMAWGPDGNLYVADPGGGWISRYDGITGAFIDFPVFNDNVGTNGVENPRGLDFDHDGNLLVLDKDSFSPGTGTSRIRRFDPSFAFISDWLDPALNEYGIRVGPDGLIYTVAYNSNKILVFDSTGTSSTLVDLPGVGFVRLDFIVPEPAGGVMLGVGAMALLRRRGRPA